MMLATCADTASHIWGESFITNSQCRSSTAGALARHAPSKVQAEERGDAGLGITHSFSMQHCSLSGVCQGGFRTSLLW